MAKNNMTPERHREISSLGGRRVHEYGTGHEWTSDEAKTAGRLGGLASAAARLAKNGTARPLPSSAAMDDDGAFD